MENCLNCNSKLQGRKGKMYCTESCKSAHQYEQRKTKDAFFIKVDRQLKVNRKILKKHNQAGFTTLRKSVLIEEGFNPKFFTHYWKNQKGQVYLFCYDYGFLDIPEKSKFLIVAWQDYMN